jgi:hypothetical protein
MRWQSECGNQRDYSTRCLEHSRFYLGFVTEQVIVTCRRGLHEGPQPSAKMTTAVAWRAVDGMREERRRAREK